MKNFIRDYLTFNKRERNGVFVLLTIIVLLLVYLNVSDKFISPPKLDLASIAKQLDSLKVTKEDTLNSDEQDRWIKTSSHESAVKQAIQKAERFEFDPNQLPAADWKRLGLNDKQIRMILNYEAKGGSFRKKEDVKKMYCINEELYNSLEPYIRIATGNKAVAANANFSQTPKTTAPVAIIELNDADSAQLTTLKGIGAFYAKTIISYRNSLGGFYAKEQLLEVWKFDAEKYAAIEKYVTVDVAKIRKRNVNALSAEQLKSPYLTWNIVNAIVNYRKSHGRFKTIDEIRKTDLVDDETLRKIAPYLTLD